MEACHRKNKEVLTDKPFTFVFPTEKQKKTKKKKTLERELVLLMVCVGVNEERKRERVNMCASVCVWIGMGGNLCTSESNDDGEIIPLVLVVAGRRGGCTYTQRDTSLSVHHVSFCVSILHLISRVAVVFALSKIVGGFIKLFFVFFLFSTSCFHVCFMK